MADTIDGLVTDILRLGKTYNPAPESASAFNPDGRNDNCVWVSVAAYMACGTDYLACNTRFLENKSGMKAPDGFADWSEIHRFLVALKASGINIEKSPGNMWSEIIGFINPGSDVGHCVIRHGERYICYQHSSQGEDVTSQITPETQIVLNWYCPNFSHINGASVEGPYNAAMYRDDPGFAMNIPR